MLTFLLFTAASGLYLLAQQNSTGLTPYDRLEAGGWSLPESNRPIGNYVPYVRTGNLLFLAGHGYCGEACPGDTGKLGADLNVEQGYEAARRVGLCMLATLEAATGDLNKVKRIVRVNGLVNATPDFTDHPKVINGFSDFMVAIFGENGKHARVAQGAASLPKNMSVEVEMLVELYEN